MMKKRLVSMILALALCMGLAVPGFAVENTGNANMNQSEFYTKDGILYARTGDVECYRIGDEIFAGNERVATVIVRYDTPNAVMPIGEHWRYIEGCPYGTRNEYTKHIAAADRVVDIELDKKLKEYTETLLSDVIKLALGPVFLGASFVGKLALTMATSFVSTMKIDPIYGNIDALYVKERVMAHETMSSIYRMSVLFCYTDIALQHPTEDPMHILYQCWA